MLISILAYYCAKTLMASSMSWQSCIFFMLLPQGALTYFHSIFFVTIVLQMQIGGTQ